MEVKGNFRGTVVDGAVSCTKNGFAQAVIKLHADEMWDEENKEWAPWDDFGWEPDEIDDRDGIVYACIFGSKGPTFVVDDLKEIFSWDGQSLGALDSLMAEGVKIQWTNALDTYNDVTSMKSDGIKAYDAAPGTTLKTLDVKEMAALDAKFATFLKAEAKPEKAATSKRRSRSKAADKTEAPVEEAKTEEPKADKPKRAARGSKKKAKAEASAAKTSAPPADPPEEEETVEEQADATFGNVGPCTKAEAWDDINKSIPEGTEDSVVSACWLASIAKVGDGKKQKELTEEEWSSVRADVIDTVGTF